jgi:hypothetical protein
MRCGATIDDNFCIRQRNEQQVDIVNVPYQYLGCLVSEVAQRARTLASWYSRLNHPTHAGLREIDKLGSKRASSLSKEDSGMLQTITIGGGIGKDLLATLDQTVDPLCDYCGEEVGTVDHYIWRCRFSRQPDVSKTRNLRR